ncbi:MAG: hypothetical protein HFI29_07005 [Lachnospiraceae bacterium]|jgi:hypothetical protein|nr:hypothetical protein [Lachnospiraceae bacterium]
MNNGSYPWYLSWPVIIIAFLFFWPAAIVLIYLRTQSTKGGAFAAASNKKVYMILGGILILFGLTRFKSSIPMALFMIVGGAAIIYYANTLAKKASRNKSYIDLLVNQGETSIDKVANMLNVRYDVALKELKTMKSLGILKGATIDEQSRSVSITRVQNAAGEISGMVNSVTGALIGSASTAAASGAAETVEGACPGCGAKYTGPKGSTVTCSYCDATFVLH